MHLLQNCSTDLAEILYRDEGLSPDIASHILVTIGTGPYLRAGLRVQTAKIMMNKTLMCPPVSVYHISVQSSFNVDQFMQTFDS